jgi:enoyl-CoA hydratase/carnithine racemase
MSEGNIEAIKDAATGWLLFSNPERLNAVSYEMWRATSELIAEFVLDPGIRVIVLRGKRDKALISGADIS